MKAELSACVIQKFNGYDLLRVELNRNEKKNLIPTDIVFLNRHLIKTSRSVAISRQKFI